jgi:hypothetical protein
LALSELSSKRMKQEWSWASIVSRVWHDLDFAWVEMTLVRMVAPGIKVKADVEAVAGPMEPIGVESCCHRLLPLLNRVFLSCEL